MRVRTFRVAVIAVVVAGVLSACGRLGPPADEVIIRDETLVLDANARSMLTEFRDDGTLVFTSNDDTVVSTSNVGGPLPGVVVGSILVSEPTAVAPFGLLRRVTYLDTSVPGLLTVKTVQATLGEAIQKGSLSVELTIDADDPGEFIPSSPSVRVLPRSTAVADGAAAPGLGTTALEDGIGLSFDEVVYDEDRDFETNDDQVRASGELRLKPVLKLDLDFDCSGFLCSDGDIDFMFQVGVQEVARIAVTGKGVLGLNIKESIELGSYPLETYVYFIGPVPVVITPKYVIELHFDGSVGVRVAFEANQTLTAVLGAKYDDEWENLSDLDNEFSAHSVDTDSPVAAIVSGKAKGALRGELLFYGIAGPYLELVPWLGLDLKYPRDPIWRLNAGLEGNVGVKIDVLGMSKAWYSPLFNVSGQIAQSTNSAPEITFLAGPVQVSDVNLGSTLSVLVQDVEDGPTTCCVVTFRSSNASDGDDGYLGSSSGTAPQVDAVFTTLGDRTITATATDSKGKSATATIVVRVVNTTPLVFRTMPVDNQSYFQGQSVKLRSSSYDPNEPDFALPCSALTWTSSRGEDPFPVSGCDVTVSFPSTGTRTLTLTGTDAHGASATSTVTVNVTSAPANLPPIANVTSPANGRAVAVAETLTLAGTASDPEGGAVTTTWDLLTEYNPLTGTGGTLYPVTPGPGGTWRLQDSVPSYAIGCGYDMNLRLRFSAQDAGGAVGRDFVVLKFIVIC